MNLVDLGAHLLSTLGLFAGVAHLTVHEVIVTTVLTFPVVVGELGLPTTIAISAASKVVVTAPGTVPGSVIVLQVFNYIRRLLLLLWLLLFRYPRLCLSTHGSIVERLDVHVLVSRCVLRFVSKLAKVGRILARNEGLGSLVQIKYWLNLLVTILFI